MDITYAQTVMERADTLAGVSEEPDALTRRFATEEMRIVNNIVSGWMREAGMTVRRDNVGNLIGHYEAENQTMDDGELKTQNSKLKTLILGSHLDTVRDAGKYDGPLGVLVALACVQRLHDRGERLPFAIEVVAFADEEGLRYHVPYLGSRALAGAFDPALLQREDDDGVRMAEAIRTFGGHPERIGEDALSGDDLLGFCEVHIEQGPVLEAEGLPVGVVSGIAGQSRISVRFEGEAGHAGTVPPQMRRDALCGGSEFVLAVEAHAKSVEGLVATVGQIAAHPGAANVIPSRVTLSLDVRHLDDSVRAEASRALQNKAAQICSGRGLSLGWEDVQTSGSVLCSSKLSELLTRAVEEQGYPVRHLPSGAGHDGVIMSNVTDVAMLFVRCKGGVSHNPAESVEVEDVAVAIEVLGRFLELMM